MDGAQLITLTRYIEQGIVLTALVILLTVVARKGTTGAKQHLPLTELFDHAPRWVEWTTVSGIALGALLLRTIFYDSGIPTPLYAAQLVPLNADGFMGELKLWEKWLRLFLEHGPSAWRYDSPLLLPVSMVSIALFGPSTVAPLFDGAFWGTLGVVAAYLLGRATVGRSFGLIFATCIACSPLQIIWSRLGFRPIAAVPHVLIASWLSFVAGKASRPLVGILAGIVTYLAIYSHDNARVAVALGPLALIWGMLSGAKSWRWKALTTSAFVGAFALMVVVTQGKSFEQTFWPKSEFIQDRRTPLTTLLELARRVEKEAGPILSHYLLFNRDPSRLLNATELDDYEVGWGIDLGGLSLVPVAFLGLIGLLLSFRSISRFRDRIFWFALLGAGFAIPALSCARSRRLLIFDLGWSAFASFAILALLNSGKLRRFSPRHVAFCSLALVVGMAMWSFGSIALLNLNTTNENHPAGLVGIPYTGRSGGMCYSDEIACRVCFERGKEWENAIGANKLVVLVDSDIARENATAPGGLPVYGHLAATRMSKSGAFQEFYPIVKNFHHDPGPGRFYSANADFGIYLSQVILSQEHDAIVWHFERPTAWERWFASRLVELGGREQNFSTPLSETEGVVVTTPAESSDAVSKLLRELAEPWSRRFPELASITLEIQPLPFQPLSLRRSKVHNAWMLSNRWNIRVQSEDISFGGYADACDMELTCDGAETRLQLAGCTGMLTEAALDGREFDLRGQRHERYFEHDPSIDRGQFSPVGRSCSAFVNGAWWMVDPIRGHLVTDQPTDWIPRHAWIGAAKRGDDELLLASADQRILLLNVREKRVMSEFPARLLPLSETDYGDCAFVAWGPHWVAHLNPVNQSVELYQENGKPIGYLSIPKNLPERFPRAFDVSGDTLGIATATHLVEMRLPKEMGARARLQE